MRSDAHQLNRENCALDTSSPEARSIPERLTKVLTDLIAIPTVNPMGRTYDGLPIERPVIEYLEKLFAPFDVQLERQSCSRIHESLLIRVPGRTQQPAILFESHIDTVPAEDWSDRAFLPHQREGRIFGRGACDDKGSLTAMVLALVAILESGQLPPQPVWLLAAADEEHAQTGIKHFLKSSPLPIGRCVIGEPTELCPVVQHKGTIRWDMKVRGRSAHTSQAELGHSAIHDMIWVVQSLTDYERELRKTYTSSYMSGPSLTVTMIQGGRTRNMVPDQCSIAVDFRILPGMDPAQTVDQLKARLQNKKISLEHSEFQCFAPALNTSPDDPFVQQVAEYCRAELGYPVKPAGVPYGSDAGWLPQHIPTIVLGPGSIAQAHAVDEFVEVEQLEQAAEIYRRVLLHEWHQ